MSLLEFDPPLSAPQRVGEDLSRRGFALAGPDWVSELAGVPLSELSGLGAAWEELPDDPHLRDVGHYRRRRHASFVVEGGDVQQVPHRPHFQSPEYNSLHGGMQRWFEPIRDELLSAPAWPSLLGGLGTLFGTLSPTPRWFVEAHQFRIHTEEGVGRPTPEGAHRDGVDFVALFLVNRRHVRGGETRLFDAREPTGLRFTLREPWTVLLLDDARVVHESTPILPEQASGADEVGHRDTLVLTYRRGGFQAPSSRA